MNTFENVTTIVFDDPSGDESLAKLCHIVGTAHISKESIDEVAAVIAELKPDTVCVELCASRHKALTGDQGWKKLDVFQVIREGKTVLVLANLVIGAYQRKLGKALGTRPGGEMLVALEKAAEINAQVELIDRDIQVTLKRTWAALSWTRKAKLFASLFGAWASQETVDAEEIESMKENLQLSQLMQDFAKEMPDIHKTLIDERDQYMMAKLRAAPGKTIVAVVGAGHVGGMKTYQTADINLEELSELPKPAHWVKALKWLIPLAVLGAFASGIAQQQHQTLEQMIYAWVIPNAAVCALFTLLAGGRAGSIAVAFIASPITSLNPLLGAGMVVGLTEAWLRKPTVADAETIADDVETIKGIYKNPVTRVMLVAVMSTIGSALGAWIGFSLILRMLPNF